MRCAAAEVITQSSDPSHKSHWISSKTTEDLAGMISVCSSFDGSCMWKYPVSYTRVYSHHFTAVMIHYYFNGDNQLYSKHAMVYTSIWNECYYIVVVIIIYLGEGAPISSYSDTV